MLISLALNISWRRSAMLQYKKKPSQISDWFFQEKNTYLLSICWLMTSIIMVNIISGNIYILYTQVCCYLYLMEELFFDLVVQIKVKHLRWEAPLTPRPNALWICTPISNEDRVGWVIFTRTYVEKSLKYFVDLPILYILK